MPIPALADAAQLSGCEFERIRRTGAVASTDSRNRELLPDAGPERRCSQSRSVARDMERAAIAAKGTRLRVAYGTLLCVAALQA